MEVLVSMSIVIFLFSISFCLIHYNSWAHYKPIYNTLKSRTYYLNGDLLYSRNFDTPDDGFVYFRSCGSIKLNEDIYIHNHLPTFFDPYSLYYLYKFQAFFKNLDENKIQMY